MSRKTWKTGQKGLLILYLSQNTHISKQNLYYDDGNSKVSCKVQKHFHGILDYWSNLNHFGYDCPSGGDHSVMENKN